MGYVSKAGVPEWKVARELVQGINGPVRVEPEPEPAENDATDADQVDD